MSIIQDFYDTIEVILPEIGDEGEVKKSYRSCDWCWWFRLSRLQYIAPRRGNYWNCRF
jgi:hypothetical protein